MIISDDDKKKIEEVISRSVKEILKTNITVSLGDLHYTGDKIKTLVTMEPHNDQRLSNTMLANFLRTR
jgi:hypothetical protein